MFDLLPLPASGVTPGSAGTRLAVDPAALAQVAAELQQRAAALRAGSPALLAAWQQAASTLAGQHTGAVLAATAPGTGTALEAFGASVEALARALRSSAAGYASAELSAVPRRPEP